MKILLVAKDVAPSNAFNKLAVELKKLGHETLYFLGGGQPIAGASDGLHISSVKPADVVLVGMSSSESLAREEIETMAAAITAGVPVGCYADAFGAFTRPWFSHLRDKINFLFVLNEEEAAKARPLFPNAKVVVSGNPTWDDFFSPKMSREDARAKLCVAGGRKVMFCLAAGKILAANMGNFVDMISASVRLGMESERYWHLVFSLHPGDKDFNGLYRAQTKAPMGEVEYLRIDNIYSELKKYSRVPITIATRSLIHTGDGLSAADVVIDSGSTSGIEAVVRNIPTIAYITEVQWNRIREQTGERLWPTVEQGCVPLAEEPGELANKIRAMLMFNEFEHKYLPRQRECYPKPKEFGVALRIMAEVILGTAKTQ